MYVVVKTGNFYNSLVEKSHKDIYATQNDNSEGSKTYHSRNRSKVKRVQTLE